jgi:Zn-finger nucleic acid-binding protein
MADRSGVEIDYCPKCRGVWLDRGELDKVIERSAAPAPQNRSSGYGERREDRDYRSDRDYDKRYHGKRREGFLSELFDF